MDFHVKTPPSSNRAHLGIELDAFDLGSRQGGISFARRSNVAALSSTRHLGAHRGAIIGLILTFPVLL